jgi:DNA-binding Xre family transcriptional regulator
MTNKDNKMTIEHIKRFLADKRLSVISEKTGLSIGTLRALRDGQNDNPTIKTLEKLTAYMEDSGYGF